MAELGVRAPLPLLEQQVSPDPNPNPNRKRNPSPNPSPNPKQPLLLSLGAARVQTAANYLEGYVGRERLAEFVRLHPQSLLWMPDEDTPAAQVRARARVRVRSPNLTLNPNPIPNPKPYPWPRST